MLYEFIDLNRDVIISRARDRVRSRPWPSVGPGEVEHGVPLFLTQLSETLRLEATSAPFRLRELIDCTLSEVRLEAGQQKRARLPVVAFIDEIVGTGMLHSESFGSPSSLLTRPWRSTQTRSFSRRPS